MDEVDYKAFDVTTVVILISHDRHIIETCVDELWLVHDGTVTRFDGDMDDYTRLVLERSRQNRRAGRAAKTVQPEQRPAAKPVAAPKATDKLDRKMDELRGKIDILDKALSDPQIFAREPKKAADFGKLRAKLAAELEDFENQWLEAQI